MQIKTNEIQKELKEHGNFHFPFLVSHEKLSRYDSGSFLWHWHPEIELTFVTKGEMIYHVNKESFLLSQGQALFGNSSTLHAGTMTKNRDCEYISITFEPKLLYGYDNSSVYTKYIKPVIQNYSLPAVHFDFSDSWHEEALHLIQNIIQADAKKQPAYELDILSALAQFWKLLYLHNASSVNISIDKKSYDRIREMISYVEEHYAEPITLEDISQSIHICKSECSRLFSKYMNLSLFEFISQYRIEKSIDYLINTSYSMTEIANFVGFSDSNYFAKVFRRIKDCSPTKYRSVNK